MALGIRSHSIAVTACALTVCSGAAHAQDGRPPLASLNLMGAPGLIDMPSGEPQRDAELSATVSGFAGINRATLTFQITPWASGSFRYTGTNNWNADGFSTYYDRSFDLRFRLLEEGDYAPAISLGLQDFAGTGLQSAEFLAATKTLLPGLKATLGIGWGRLASYGSFGNPLGGERPTFDINSRGGSPNFDQWFRGPAAPFGGVEWQANDRLAFKAEYSSDGYIAETVDRDLFDRRSPLNFGAEYRIGEVTTLGAYYMYGSKVGLMLNFSANSANPPAALRHPAPKPIRPRPDRRVAPAAWGTGWVANPTAPQVIEEAIAPKLEAEGLRLEALNFEATTASLWFSNVRYQSETIAIGRAARVMADVLPPSVETFRLTPFQNGLPGITVTIQRTALERYEFDQDAAGSLLAASALSSAQAPASSDIQASAPYPEPSWSLVPYLRASFFDPDLPLRVDGGLRLNGGIDFAPGFSLRGSLTKRLFGNIADADFVSDSLLPPVRTNAVLYAREGDPGLERLILAEQSQVAPNIYTRLSAGYFEQMFGGLAAEALWSPVDRPYAFGAELAYARQRDFDQRFGFQDYDVVTGHLSAYYDFNGGYYGQVDAGRYLAGDIGATISLDRVFANGASIGAFATFTDASAEEFGEGSFDKGIRFTIPLSWFLGQPTPDNFGTTIRPVLRDGGARLEMPVRLYEQVRDYRRGAIERQWGGVWK